MISALEQHHEYQTVPIKRERGVVLPPHTFFDIEDVLFFSDEQWSWLLSKRGTAPEEKGYFFGQRPRDPPTHIIVSMFRYKTVEGSFTEVSEDPRFLKAVNIFLSRHHLLSILPYHTHPIDGLSSGDIRTLYEIYKGSDGIIHDFIIICPSNVRIERFFGRTFYEEPGSYYHTNLVGKKYLRVVGTLTPILNRYEWKARSYELKREFGQIVESQIRR